MNIALGTASFGQPYGIAQHGEVSQQDVDSILQLSLELGMDTLDTAHLYGNAESVLGNFDRVNQFKIVNKLPVISSLSQQQVLSLWQRSLEKLTISKTYGCLLHKPEDLLCADRNDNYHKLKAIKDLGLTQKIGVSVYTPKELDEIIKQYAIDLVQVPMNVFDQRFISSGVLKRAKQKGIEIHVRSAFLQGLLLMETEQLSAHFSPYLEHINTYFKAVRDAKLTKLDAAFAYLQTIPYIDKVVVGCHNIEQLHEIEQSFKRTLNSSVGKEFAGFKHSDEQFILPTNWSV
jgi:aryl-alcohol dehydrogenase-like predicted oxidoreductase